MNNMITISNMSRAFRQNPLRTSNSIGDNRSSFSECIQKETEKNVRESNNPVRSEYEYRMYLNDRLQNLSFDSSNRMDTTMISFSDAGIRRMMDDHEYEEWVVSQVKALFSSNDPFSTLAGGKFIIMRFGENESDLSINVERAGFPNGQDSMMPKVRNEDDGFWTRREETFKEQMEINRLVKQKEAEGFSVMINPFAMELSANKKAGS